MTIQEVHTEFKLRYDKVDGLELPNIEPEEIDLMLNQAQDMYVKQRYGTNNLKHTSFEEEQKRTDDLRALIKTANLTNYPSSDENVSAYSTNFQLPTDYFVLIWEKAVINCTTCNSTVRIPTNSFGGSATYITVDGIEVEVRPIQHVEYQKIVNDAFKGPDQTKVLRLMYKDRVEIIPSTDCEVLYYICRYLKIPERVDIGTSTTFELAEHTHTEIIDMAVKIALEGIEARRNQTFDQIKNINE